MAVGKREHVAAALREAIHRGEFAAGERLPGEHELAGRYGAGRSTVHQALTQLTAEGLLTSAQGRGYVVPDRRPLIRLAATRLAREGRDSNRGAHYAEADQVGQPSTVRTRVYVEFADDDTASALEIPAGAEVLVRDRMMSIGDQPTQLAVSRYPRTLTKGTQIEHDDTGPGGVLSRLEDLGHTIGEHAERVSLLRASTTEAAALQIPLGSACLRIQRTTRSSTGRVLEVNTMTLTDRYVLVYELPATWLAHGQLNTACSAEPTPRTACAAPTGSDTARATRSGTTTQTTRIRHPDRRSASTSTTRFVIAASKHQQSPNVDHAWRVPQPVRPATSPRLWSWI
jgi:GntR family transcriptional regulator